MTARDDEPVADVEAHRRFLEEARDGLMDAVRRCKYQKDLPPLVRELRQTINELEGRPSGRKDTPADEIAARREERRRKAAGE